MTETVSSHLRQDHRPFGRIWTALCLAGVVLIAAGVGHRLMATRIGLALDKSLPLIGPLSGLPSSIGDWRGRDVPLDQEVRRVAGEDDYINREYRCERTSRTIALYIGYVGRPRSRLGHRPDLCYPVQGWTKLDETRWELPAGGSSAVPATLYEFRSPEVGGSRDLVLATYIINGSFQNDPATVGNYNSREVQAFGRGGTYVARIQIRLAATGNRADDLAALSDFGSLIIAPITSIMPHMRGLPTTRPPGP